MTVRRPLLVAILALTLSPAPSATPQSPSPRPSPGAAEAFGFLILSARPSISGTSFTVNANGGSLEIAFPKPQAACTLKFKLRWQSQPGVPGLPLKASFVADSGQVLATVTGGPELSISTAVSPSTGKFKFKVQNTQPLPALVLRVEAKGSA